MPEITLSRKSLAASDLDFWSFRPLPAPARASSSLTSPGWFRPSCTTSCSARPGRRRPFGVLHAVRCRGRLRRRRLARLAYWLFYPLALVVGWVFWAGPTDLFAIVGTVLAIAARHQRQVWRIQALIVVSTAGWGTYGLLVGSLVQVAFSTAYGLAALVNAVRFFRQPPVAEAPQADMTR